MAKRKLKLFKEPKIIRPKSGDWFVLYYFRDPVVLTKWKPFKERCGINRIKDPVEKEEEAEILRLDVLNWLQLGNSPFDEEQILEEKIVRKEKEVEVKKLQNSNWSLQTAITQYKGYIYEQKLEESTLNTYEKYVLAFEKWLITKDRIEHKACTFTEMDVLEFLNETSKKNTWSATTYNNYMTFMVTFFGRCNKLEKAKSKNRKLLYDFLADELEKKPAKPQRNKTFNAIQFEQIKEKLNVDAYKNLRDYLEWIFLSLMRPDEIRELKINKIDHDNRQIRIKGKSGDRLIPIGDQLLALINKRRLLQSNQNYYVFGMRGEVDQQRIGAGYFSGQFGEIRKELNLDNNYGPYSYKPTGVIRMIKAGFKDEEIMVLTGHKTEKAFRAYKRDLIIDNSHVMKGKTIDF